MRAIIIGVLGVGVMLSSSCYAGAQLTVSNVTVNHKGETLLTHCVNAKGYYFEIGKPKVNEHLTVYGFGGRMRLKTVVNDLLFKGWHAKFGQTVDIRQKIHWRGHKPWTEWLRRLSFQKNLAVILDWQTKVVYINRL